MKREQSVVSPAMERRRARSEDEETIIEEAIQQVDRRKRLRKVEQMGMILSSSTMAQSPPASTIDLGHYSSMQLLRELLKKSQQTFP